MTTIPIAQEVPMRLHLSALLGDALRELAKAEYPREACGLLIGSRRDSVINISRIAQARNINQKRPHDRYLMDPVDFVEADRAARADGLEIVGIWHSHPDTSAEPSATDLEAAWPEYSYLIVSTSSGGETNLRSWRLCMGHFVEEFIQAKPH
jgi:proteasome lid subunit RPN8/RPN11